MMDKLYIASKNVNLEILAKLLNSVAKKYDCYVKYDKLENSLKFLGEQSCWRYIIEEFLECIFPQPELVPVATGR